MNTLNEAVAESTVENAVVEAGHSVVAGTNKKALAEFASTQMIALGEELGKFKAYDSQLPIADIEGTRVVKCLYQANKEGKKLAENSYVRIPTNHLTEELVANRISELTPYILTYFQSIEDLAIKNDHKAGIVSVYTESLSLDKIIEALEVSEAGSRLNKEKIEAWFEAEVESPLSVLFAGKLGIDLSSERAAIDPAYEAKLVKLEQVLTSYKAKFASLASGKTYIKEEDCVAMIAVVEQVEADKSLIGSRFVARLNKMMTKEDDTLMML
tara:strand:- start:3080 stop:3889 length:810 start_codon:yes stop_codon:yes gene_type:complete